jgi:hypothetical protein
MITVLEYATLSWHTYHSHFSLFGKKHEEFQIVKQNVDKKSRHGWYQITDISRHMHPAQDFYAQLYVKFAFGKPLAGVVAFRGTLITDWDNDEVDFDVWASDVFGDGKHDQVPKYFTQAEWFYYDARRYLLDELKCHHLSVTGHSLGGAIAQLVPALMGMPTTAVTFNAPGVGHIPGVKSEQGMCIFGFNSRYGFLNKIGQSLGRVEYLEVPEKAAEAKQALVEYASEKTLGQHIEKAENLPDQLRLSFDLIFKDGPRRGLAGSDFLDAIAAQHSINNLLQTLTEKKQASLAGRAFI